MNDRVSGQTQQVSNSVSWSKDIFEMRLGQDSLRSQIGMQLDSLEQNFNADRGGSPSTFRRFRTGC